MNDRPGTQLNLNLLRLFAGLAAALRADLSPRQEHFSLS